MLIDDTNNIYAGETPIEKVYNGQTVVYEKNAGYTKLNYIETTGLQYINTNYYPTYQTDYEIDMHLTMPVARQWQQCVASTNGSYAYIKLFCASDESDNIKAQIYNDSNNILLTNSNSGRITIRTDGNKIYYNNEYYATFNTTRAGTANNPIWIAGAPQQTNLKCAMKIYGFKLWENGILVMNLIPVLDSNSTPCMYDKVNKQYYYNAGGSSFRYG